MELLLNRGRTAQRHLKDRLGASVSAVMLSAASATLLLAGCTSQEVEGCGGASACALTLPVPTSSAAAHTDGQLLGLVGQLETTTRSSRLCLQLRQDDGTVIALVLPQGTSAAVQTKTPPDGAVKVTLIGANGLGGTHTGDRIAVTPDKLHQSAQIGSCSRGPTATVGWLIRLPSASPTHTL